MFDRIMTPEFRITFVNVYHPKQYKPDPQNPGKVQDPRYSINMLFKATTDFSAMKAAGGRAAIERWGAAAGTIKLRTPFRPAEEYSKYQGYEPGWIFVRAWSATQPGVVDQNLTPILENDNRFFSGCWCRATVSPFTYDNMGNKGVGFFLNNVQLLRSDTRLDNRVAAEDDFEVVKLDDAEDDFGMRANILL